MKGSHKEEVTYICSNCNITFTSKTVKNHKSKFCSNTCKLNHSLKLEHCTTCNVDVLVVKNKKRNNFFCSKKCYHLWQSKNTKPPQSENRKSKANSLEAINKRKKTWEVKGRIFNFKENKDWKRFYKKCNSLTRAIRKEMIEEWDGFDFYSGKYIRDNLNFKPQHKEYPTLDHVYPKSKAFQEGKTPQEVTVKDNLVWTTRSNNSKKGNKYE